MIEPVSYLKLLNLVSHARAAMTDSGGLQEEATVLGVPLLILHRETEDRGFCRKGREIYEEICQEKSSQTEGKEEEKRVINEEICKCKKH